MLILAAREILYTSPLRSGVVYITNCITLTVICQAMKTGSMLSDCLYRIKN